MLMHAETSEPQTEVLRPLKHFRAAWERLPRHSAMATMHNSLRIHHSVLKRPASFLWDFSHNREFKRNHSAASRGVISAEKRGYRKSTPLSDGIRFLQLIFCCAQKRWRLIANIGFTPFEPCNQNEQIQDADCEIYSVLDSMVDKKPKDFTPLLSA